jgi:uncharacterized protein (DUF1778 family)
MATWKPKSPTSKGAKIELRVTREQKERLRAAAAKRGLPMSTWIIEVALRNANRTAGADN